MLGSTRIRVWVLVTVRPQVISPLDPGSPQIPKPATLSMAQFEEAVMALSVHRESRMLVLATRLLRGEGKKSPETRGRTEFCKILGALNPSLCSAEDVPHQIMRNAAMNGNNIKIHIIFIALVLTGCARSSIVPVGEDTYVLSRAQKGFGTAAVREDALDEARSYCNSKGMSMELLGVDEKEMVVFTADPEAQVSFKCINDQ